MNLNFLNSLKYKSYWSSLAIIIMSLPVARNGLESSPLTHMLVQIPMLAYFGFSISEKISYNYQKIIDKFDRNGVTGIFCVIFCILFWMIPRSLDAALDSAIFESLKFITIPTFIGAALKLSWAKINIVLKAFLIAQFIAMSVFLSWLYITSPVRLCNNYLEGEQKLLGWGLLVIASAFSIVLAICLFIGKNKKPHSANNSNANSHPEKIIHV